MKIVFDTNIYISAFVIPGGNAEKAYLHAIDGDFELCTSVAILTELARKLDEKFGWEKQKIAQLITSISNLATVFKTIPWLKVVSDDPDNRILECAIKAEADFLVTGDKHLLKLRNYGNFEIIKLSIFLKTAFPSRKYTERYSLRGK
ncbi:MAG: putative toxin-antitoxin system toxin component, PIN family [Thermodesulfobacteriota bacterium]|nr:putative toxin-antitoxin system toxin component, PIN family [Thermodesulfobacteriota bacterium]